MAGLNGKKWTVGSRKIRELPLPVPFSVFLLSVFLLKLKPGLKLVFSAVRIVSC